MEKIQIMRFLGDWFEDYGWITYFNQKNPDGFPVFHANTNSKPDLLLRKNNYNLGVEVKAGEDHQDILNGIDQILKYVGEYYSGRVNYRLGGGGGLQSLDGFLLATRYSKDGFLYENEANVGYLDYTGYLAKEKNMTEKPITHSLTRFLWRQWESGLGFKYYNKIRRGVAKKETTLPSKKPKVGVIVAKTDKDTKQVSNQPYLFLNSNEFVPMGCKEIFCLEE